MITLENLKKEIIFFAESDANEVLNSKKNEGFSWEMYFKFYLSTKCSLLLTEKLLDICKKEDKTNIINDTEVIREFLTKLDSEILKIKEDFLIKHNIKSVSFESKFSQIVDFFNQELSINFNGCTIEKQKELLRHEDIVTREKSIFDYLNITHMQYKYLHQKGEVLL